MQDVCVSCAVKAPDRCCSPSCVWRSAAPWTVAFHASLSLTISQFAQGHVHCISSAIQPSRLLMPSSPLNLSQHQGVFQWVSCSYQVTKILELQLQHHSFQWESGLISFKTDWFDLLAVRGTLKSLPQHHRLKASNLRRSAFNSPAPRFLGYLRVIPVIFVTFDYHISCGSELFLIHRTQRTFFSQFNYTTSYMLRLNKKLVGLTSHDPGIFFK